MAVSKYFANTYIAEVIDLSQGELQGASFIDKFGYNDQVGTAYETVWSGSNIYTYIETAGTAVVTSSNTSDEHGGTVLVQGLDADYNEVEETLTIGGAAGSVSFYRVFRASLETANTGDTNSGTITVTVDSKSAAIIDPGYGQTLMALYTIPKGKTGFLFQIDVGNSKQTGIEVQVVVRNGVTNGVWNTKAFITAREGFAEKNFHIPLTIPQKHDIEMRVKGSAVSQVSSGFELVLVEK